MARATRVTLFEREIRERLSESAVELLFAEAKLTCEGEVAPAAGGGRAFFGTAMLTVELAALGEAFRERCDAVSARRVAELAAADPRVRRRMQKLAEREASALAGGPLRPTATELRARAQGTRVQLDLDLEARL